jgi:hypothetical protein
VNFARVLAIDFSASSSPVLGANSLWVATSEFDRPIRTRNFSTRAQLAQHIERVAALDGRTLIVIDVALGWPQGLAQTLGVNSRHDVVAVLNDMMVDDDNNHNNRFEVANELNRCARAALWWGHPQHRSYDSLSMTTKVPLGLRERPFSSKRLIEHHVGGVIKSPMQLSGVGAVGGQSMLAQVMFERLRQRGVPLSVWPFDEATSQVVVAEQFFSLAPWRNERGTLTDQRQVRAVARSTSGALLNEEPLTSWDLLGALSSEQRQVVRREEGWLMGWSSETG